MHDLYPVLKPNHNRFPWLTVLLILAMFIFIGTLWSCSKQYTPEKATADVTNANNKQPATVADLTRKLYPCITKQADTITNTHDSLIYIQCPDSVVVMHEEGPTDTVWFVKRIPIHLPVQTQTIKVYIEDSARIKSLFVSLEAAATRAALLQEAKDKLQAQKDEWQGKARKRFWIMWGLAAVLGLMVGYRVKKFFTPKMRAA